MTMLEYLVVRLSPDPENAAWVVLDSAGQRLSAVERGSLRTAADAAAKRRVLVLVSGLDAVRTQASLPVRNAARLRQMLPWSLEDEVAESPGRVHFAAGPREASGIVSVAMVARKRMSGWLDECERAGLHPERIHSEADGVPAVPGCLALVVEGDRIHGRAPGQAPFTLQGLALPEVLQIARSGIEEGTGPAHVILYADAEGYAACEADVARLRERGVGLDVQLLREGLLPTLGAAVIDQPGCNLVQGAYGRKIDWRTRLRPWRFAAALLCGTLVLAIAAEGVRYLALSREERAVTASLESVCQRAMRTSDAATCEAAARRRLAPAATGNDADFLAALDAVALAWNGDARLEALSFRSGVLDLQVVTDSVSWLDAFARDVSRDDAFQASIQSANPTRDGILGRLQVVVNP